MSSELAIVRQSIEDDSAGDAEAVGAPEQHLADQRRRLERDLFADERKGNVESQRTPNASIVLQPQEAGQQVRRKILRGERRQIIRRGLDPAIIKITNGILSVNLSPGASTRELICRW